MSGKRKLCFNAFKQTTSAVTLLLQLKNEIGSDLWCTNYLISKLRLNDLRQICFNISLQFLVSYWQSSDFEKFKKKLYIKIMNDDNQSRYQSCRDDLKQTDEWGYSKVWILYNSVNEECYWKTESVCCVNFPSSCQAFPCRFGTFHCRIFSPFGFLLWDFFLWCRYLGLESSSLTRTHELSHGPE